MHSPKLALTSNFSQLFSSHLQIIIFVCKVTWMVTSNQKKAFLIVWTHMSEKRMLLQWNQWKKTEVRYKCVTSRVLAQLFSPVLQPWIQCFHFTSFWSQIQLKLTIYLSHRHICRLIATTGSHVQYPRKTTNCRRTGGCWNSSSHVGSDHHQSTCRCYHWLFTPDRLSACPSLAWREQSMEWRSMETVSPIHSQML